MQAMLDRRPARTASEAGELLGVADGAIDPDLPIVFVCLVGELGLIAGWAWSGRQSKSRRPT